MAHTRNHEAVAREFWAGTGLSGKFPRDIEKAVALKLPLALVKLPQVTVPAVRGWLEARRLRGRVPNDQRDLMGCLVAYRGLGIAFICGADPDEEQRLTVGHETAHFLRDYFLPRQELLAALGDEMADVLDGKRPPTTSERANAVLAHMRLGTHVHLLPRNGQDEDSDPAVAAAEDKADDLSLELLAPRERILKLLHAAGEPHQTGEECIALGRHFGVPPHVFHRFTERREEQRFISFLEDIRPALEAGR
jgi:Zn-dependent peptidase ImmA (M78 family)